MRTCELLAHRKKACGDDGGGASATLGYIFGAYPWAEQNYFYTWLSSTGENIAGDWPHSAMLANYVLWNWIETGAQPLEFGYGDTPHTRNTLPIGQLYTHMANVQHLFAQTAPKAAALARYLQQRLPSHSYSSTWFIYPFLLSGTDHPPEPFAPTDLPHGRYFETMGQVFLRSGTGADDTYCLFSCGGILSQHRHYDALNFILYHRGFLALDSGTRYEEFVNGEHLANYYAQTVAHNCVLIHQPGEPPARYWGGTVTGNEGGQHKATRLGPEGVRDERRLRLRRRRRHRVLFARRDEARFAGEVQPRDPPDGVPAAESLRHLRPRGDDGRELSKGLADPHRLSTGHRGQTAAGGSRPGADALPDAPAGRCGPHAGGRPRQGILGRRQELGHRHEGPETGGPGDDGPVARRSQPGRGPQGRCLSPCDPGRRSDNCSRWTRPSYCRRDSAAASA